MNEPTPPASPAGALPASTPTKAEREESLRERYPVSRLAVFASLLPVIAGVGCGVVFDPLWAIVGAVVGSVVAVPVGVVSLVRLHREKHLGRGGRKRSMAIVAIGLSIVALLGAALAWALDQPNNGRPFRRRGRAQLPGSRPRGDWSIDVDAAGLRAEVGDDAKQVAAAWRKAAASETASIAAFIQSANELLALGAPADLIDRSLSAARDEVRHARLFHAVADALGDDPARATGPAAFGVAGDPAPPPTLHTLAVDALVDGLVHEAAAADVLQACAQQAPPTFASVLADVANDEARHAVLARNVVAWCRAEGDVDDALRAALQAALQAAGNSFSAVVSPADAALERFGVGGRALRARCTAARWEQAREFIHMPHETPRRSKSDRRGLSETQDVTR